MRVEPNTPKEPKPSYFGTEIFEQFRFQVFSFQYQSFRFHLILDQNGTELEPNKY